MVEAILLQILPSIREALWLCTAYHCNHLVSEEHVLLHCLIFPLLDLIESPYHGIIVAPVTKSLLHVHQRVLHGDILPSSSMRAHLMGYPQRLAKMWGCMLASSYCSRKATTLKCQSMYITSAPG